MKHHEIFRLGLSLFEEVGLEEFSHEELLSMCAGRVLKAFRADRTMSEFPDEEIRESAERVARICLVLAFFPQRLEIPEI